MSNLIVNGMRPRVLRRWLTLAGFGAILAGSFFGAGLAKATPAQDNTFLSQLDSHGITYASKPKVITAGYAICVERESSTEEQVVDLVVSATRLMRWDAVFFVEAAESAFCPEYLAAPVYTTGHLGGMLK